MSSEQVDNFGSSAKFIKKGESAEIQIKSITKIEIPEHTLNMKKKGGVDSGLHYIIETPEGEQYPVSAWAFYFALKDLDIQLGDTIKVDHPDTGKYVVTKLAGKVWDE